MDDKAQSTNILILIERLQIRNKVIFTDVKADSTCTIQQENFARITVYAPPDYRPPYLFEFTHGNNNYEDWETEWELYQVYGDARAIREAIKRLDSYELKELEERWIGQ